MANLEARGTWKFFLSDCDPFRNELVTVSDACFMFLFMLPQPESRYHCWLRLGKEKWRPREAWNVAQGLSASKTAEIQTPAFIGLPTPTCFPSKV